MQSGAEALPKKEIIVRRISAAKFEVYDATPPPPPPSKEEDREEENRRLKENETPKEEQTPPRKSVIQRAPPAAPPPPKRRREADTAPTGVILIRDAIMYRIVDIMMWKVLGESQLKAFGYPSAPTHQVLWRIVHRQYVLSGAKKLSLEHLPQDHDCEGNIECFISHVYQFLEVYAPNLWKRTGWGKFSCEEVLRRIYYEGGGGPHCPEGHCDPVKRIKTTYLVLDLIPYLRGIDLRNNFNLLQCHSDIVLLEKWEKQKFTAVTWSGQKYISQMSINCPRCPQCSNRHF